MIKEIFQNYINPLFDNGGKDETNIASKSQKRVLKTVQRALDYHQRMEMNSKKRQKNYGIALSVMAGLSIVSVFFFILLSYFYFEPDLVIALGFLLMAVTSGIIVSVVSYNPLKTWHHQIYRLTTQLDQQIQNPNYKMPFSNRLEEWGDELRNVIEKFDPDDAKETWTSVKGEWKKTKAEIKNKYKK